MIAWSPFIEERKKANLLHTEKAAIQCWQNRTRHAMWFDRPKREEEMTIRILVETGKIRPPPGYGIRPET
jgi:hypothetical protein